MYLGVTMRCGTFSCTLPDSSRATRRASGRNVLMPVPGVPAARSGAATAASRPEQPTEPIDRHGECAMHMPATPLPRARFLEWSAPCTARLRFPNLGRSDRLACVRQKHQKKITSLRCRRRCGRKSSTSVQRRRSRQPSAASRRAMGRSATSATSPSM